MFGLCSIFCALKIFPLATYILLLATNKTQSSAFFLNKQNFSEFQIKIVRQLTIFVGIDVPLEFDG